ncbi:hypothetical protein F3157_16670 [Virgibacillus dakarensis]|nr:hypothetical protein [Virgibacillus dakarensis]
MKKYLFVFILIMFILTGCSFSVGFGNDSEKQEDEKEDLTLQLTKVDEEAGVTLENETYQEISKMIQDDPDMGAANDFSVYTINIYETEFGKKLFLLGINRLPFAIHNISFQFTLKGKDGEQIYKNLPVQLKKSEIGTFQQDGAIPFTLDLTAEQAEQLMKMNSEDMVLEINDFKYEKAA